MVVAATLVAARVDERRSAFRVGDPVQPSRGVGDRRICPDEVPVVEARDGDALLHPAARIPDPAREKRVV